MKINFKKIATILGSAILVGSTLGMAAAANYPAPFNQEASAIVVGSNPAPQDIVAAANIANGLSTATTTTSATSGVTVSGEAVALDSGSTRIWLNTSLSTAKTTLTKSDLPTVLGESTFSGNVDSKITSTLTVGSNKVTFAKQPSSSDDPVIGITMNTSSAAPLYNVSATMSAINFTSADSKGETIHLFGKDFVVSTATDSTSLVLFSAAQEVTLTAGGSAPKSTANVTIDGKPYVIELVTGSGTTSATIAVNGESRQITSGQSKKVGGIDVAVKSTTESTALNTITATVLVGSNKLTFTNGQKVTQGSDDDPIDGTLVTITGGTTATTGINVGVFAPSSSEDAILAGQSFVDPVFGSFKVDFAGISSPLNDSARGMLKVDKSGDKGMSLTLTDSQSNEKTFDFVYNTTGVTQLNDSNGYKIFVKELANLSQNSMVMIGNEDYGHLIQVTGISNNTGTDYTKDSVSFRDVITGDNYKIGGAGADGSFTSEGLGQITIDGKQYTVNFGGDGDGGWTTIKYPTTDSASTERILFPTMKTDKGALVALYEPQSITLNNGTLGLTALKFPDGDGYTTSAALATDNKGNFTLGGSALNASAGVNVTVGNLIYNLGQVSSNVTSVKLVNPSTGALISAPAVVMFEGKDTNSEYEAVIAILEALAAGTSTNPLGLDSVVFTSPTQYSATLQSDSDITDYVDFWGTEVTLDANTASQATATISYPASQVYANVFIGANGAVVSGGNSGSTSGVGAVTVFDSEVDSVKSKNLIVVGGSCVNTVAATLLGSSTPLCGADFTAKTGVGNGQFLVQVYGGLSTGKIAMLVAGYEAADTTKAATYLTTNTVSTAVGTVVKKTSANYADVV